MEGQAAANSEEAVLREDTRHWRAAGGKLLAHIRDDSDLDIRLSGSREPQLSKFRRTAVSGRGEISSLSVAKRRGTPLICAACTHGGRSKAQRRGVLGIFEGCELPFIRHSLAAYLKPRCLLKTNQMVVE